MRADRLLSILLLLQARGRMTAAALADELEVSERTIYRDIDALSAAGVPVYGEPGPSGGFALVDQYRTRLTGLTHDEVKALFMLSIPEPLVRLGVDDHLRSALRKLAASLPEARRGDEVRTRQRFHLDAEWWRQADENPPQMQAIHEAVWNDRRVAITYKSPFAGEIVQVVEPHGLVAKAGVWYLVFRAKGRMRVLRLSVLGDVRDMGEAFERQGGFDLEAHWRAWCREQEALRAGYRVTVTALHSAVPELRRRFGVRELGPLGEAGSGDGAKRERLELRFESLEEARERLLGLGRLVQVIEPWALRRSVQDYAEQILAQYDEETQQQNGEGGNASLSL